MVLMPPNPTTREDIFNEEFLPHSDALLTFAYSLTLNQADAEDLLQDTLVKAFRFIDSYEAGTNPKAWLFTILKNAFINKYRKESKRPTKVTLEDVFMGQNDDHSPYSTFQDLNVEMFDQMMGDEVSIAINSLGPNFRMVIILCDLEGFTYEEIAALIGIPIGTVRSRLFRARNALKEKLRTYAESLGYKDQRK